MREILFRGKREYDGKWIEGSLCTTIPSDEGFYTISFFDCEGYYIEERVSPETVGQYTGLTDKNGTKIFEGDIVKGKDHLEKDLEVYGYIDHKNGSFVIVGDFMTHYRWLDYEIEVIGNTTDNPELLKGGADND